MTMKNIFWEMSLCIYGTHNGVNGGMSFPFPVLLFFSNFRQRSNERSMPSNFLTTKNEIMAGCLFFLFPYYTWQGGRKKGEWERF